MARLDDDQLNISPEVAAVLGYYARRANAAPSSRNARAEAQPHPAHDQGDGFYAFLFGAFGVALVVLILIYAGIGKTSIVSRAGSTVTADTHLQTSARSRETQRAAVSEPAPQQQAPPAIETNPETDSQQTMQSPPQSESVPNSVEASAPSFQWVCDIERVMLCALRDPNGAYIEMFRLENGELVQSGINPDAVRPRSWGCQTDGARTKIYCTVQDENGQFLQRVLYDGNLMQVITKGDRFDPSNFRSN